MPTCFSSVAAKTFYLLITLKHKRNPVADPGFSGGGGANSQSGCANLFFCYMCPIVQYNVRGSPVAGNPDFKHGNRSKLQMVGQGMCHTPF